MQNIWVVRAGEGNEVVEEFQRLGVVGYGGAQMGDLKRLGSREAIAEKVHEVLPSSKGAMANWAGQYWKISSQIQTGDYVLTPVKATREILIGKIMGDYEFSPEKMSVYPHIRKVEWLKTVHRDVFPRATRNALGSTLTIFSMNHHRDILMAVIEGRSRQDVAAVADEESEEAQTNLYEETKSKAEEIIADRLHKLGPYEFQDMVAAVLRAMGLRTRVSEPGPDRGVDIVAYPDALGFESPRIKVQVKHRKGGASGPDMRNFMSTLIGDDKGLFVSTGGFTRDASDEPERRGKPVTLLDLDGFVDVMLEYYDKLENEYRALIPLRRIYIPIEPEE